MKNDIREYSASELSIMVFNTENLYNERHNKDFINLLREDYIFTEEQLNELLVDLEEDLKTI
tara:strand:+ start:54 stop:239 length:186 start_codon:yes stop_codon:yes gene_type:complete